MDDSRQDFVAGLYPAAVRVAQENGLSWQLLVGQSVMETDYGRRGPPAAHNLFWQPAGPDWAGSAAAHPVREYAGGRWSQVDRPFRAYGSIEEALRDHVAVLRASPELSALFRSDVAGDPEKEAQALQLGGYSTDPQYAQHLAGVLASPRLQDALSRIGALAGPADARGASTDTLQQPFLGTPITDTAHPQHALFAEVGRQVERQRVTPASPAALAALTLQMLEHGIRTPEQIRAVAMAGAVAHVQGDAPGARASLDLEAPAPALQQTSERIARVTAADEAQQQGLSQERPPPGP